MGNGDPQPQSVGDSTSAQLQAFIQGLPGLMQATNAQITPAAQAQLGASTAVAGPTNQLATNLANQYLPQLAQLGSNVANQGAQNAASTATTAVQNNGTQLASAERAADMAAHPEYYSNLNTASNKMNELLGSINLNGLSPGQAAAVERPLNQANAQTGNVNVPSATNTVTNALNYGAAYTAKQNQLSDALKTATGFLPSTQSSFVNPNQDTLTAAAAGANPSTNVGISQFQGINGNAGSNANNLATSFLGNINNTANNSEQLKAGVRTNLDNVNGVMSSLPNIS